MPTIDQLAPATATSDTDELIVNQNGITNRATRAQMLAGVQAELTLPSGTVLGRASAGIGLAETLTVGANLNLNAGTLSAVASPYLVAQAAAGSMPTAGDLIAMSQAGTNTAITLAELATGILTLPGLNASALVVQPTGSSGSETLANLAAGTLPLAGGTLSGALVLAADPVVPMEAATKDYVDLRTAVLLPVSGGTLTGALLLATNPIAPLQAATKQYVDSRSAGAAALPLTGGTLSGPLILDGTPTVPLEASSKLYVDAAIATVLPLVGGTLSGPLTLLQGPTLVQHATSKAYVDGIAATGLTISGGTLSGSLTLAADPTQSMEAATKEYVDGQVGKSLSLGGGTLTGALALSGNPSTALEAATKQYVDSQMAGPAALPLSGGTLTGALTLSGDPAIGLQAATKHYVDTTAAQSLPLTGGTLTGQLGLTSNPTGPLGASPKQYVDQISALNLALSGGTMTGPLILSGSPSGTLAATTKAYVDTEVATALPLAGGTLLGNLTLASDPTTAPQAATKAYVDGRVAMSLPLGGGSLSGSLLLSAAPAQTLQAATKGYVDAAVAIAVPLSGGTMAGMLTLSGPPDSPLSATTREYVDAIGSSNLALSGGTLTGPLTLAADPATPLESSTKQYVDGRTSTLLGLGGGTLTGTLSAPTLTIGGPATIAGELAAGGINVVQAGAQTTSLQAQIGIARNGSGPNDAPLMTSDAIVSHSGGSGLSYSNVTLTTTVNDAVNSSGAFIDGTSSDVYAFVSTLNVNSVTGSGATPTDSQHVAITGAATKGTPVGGYPAGRVGAQMWGLWLPVVDSTNLPSTISGATTGIELDTDANNVDPDNSRKAFQFVLNEARSLTSGGLPNEWAYGIYFTTSATGFYKFQISAGGNYSIAVLDTRNAFPGQAKVSAGLTAPSTTLAVTSALPFTSAGVYGLPVSATNAATISVGGSRYTQVGCTLDGPGLTSGSLTFTTPVSVADGTLGNVVLGNSRTIWMATGQQIALDYAGSANLLYDTAVGGPHLTASLHVDGAVTAAGGLATTAASVSDTAQIGGALTVGGGLTVTAGYVALPSYTVGALPTAPNGAVAYASNGRKPWEGAGSGTGVLVWVSTNRWLSLLSGTQVLG